MISQRPKVLAIAFAMEPGRGSEPGVGWNFVSDLARTQPVWVICHASHQAVVEAYLAKNPTAHPIHARYLRLSPVLEWMNCFSYSTFNVYYYLWQQAARKIALEMHRQVKFDIVQHVSLVRWWMPSAGAVLAEHGVKFIWGPIGGGELLDKRFCENIGIKNAMIEHGRALARGIWSRDGSLHRCAQATDLSLCSSRESVNRVKHLGVKNVEMLSDVSPEIRRDDYLHLINQPRKRFRFISGGGLVYWKRFDVAIRAFARAQLPDAEYVHVCGGAELPKLQKLVHELHLDDRVHFLGELNYNQCVEQIAQSDAYVHPVFRDSSGLIIEAMSLGVPVLTIDHLAPGFLVDSSAGHKVPITPHTTIESIIADMSAVMKKWHDDRASLDALRQGAIARGIELSRSTRGQKMRQIHERLLGSTIDVKNPAANVDGASSAHAAA